MVLRRIGEEIFCVEVLDVLWIICAYLVCVNELRIILR